jgi:hypothetical protein
MLIWWNTRNFATEKCTDDRDVNRLGLSHMSQVPPVEKSSLCRAFLQGINHGLITWRPKTKISSCYTKNPIIFPSNEFQMRVMGTDFGAINSCFSRIYLYALIQLLLSVIVVHFECYVRPFVERGLGCCTKTSVFSTVLGPMLQTGLVTLWHKVWEVMEYTSYSPDAGPSV